MQRDAMGYSGKRCYNEVATHARQEDDPNMSPSDLEAIRTLVREEIKPIGDKVDTLRSEMHAEFAQLRRELAGVIDSEYPAIASSSRAGGPPASGKMAAKPR